MRKALLAIIVVGISLPGLGFAQSSDEKPRLVKRTKTHKRHYKKPHDHDSDRQSSAAAEGVLLGLELLSLVVEAAAESDEEDEDDDAYEEAWGEEDDTYEGEVFVRLASGMVFQQPVNSTLAHNGLTTALGVGLVATPDDFLSGPRLWVEGGLWIDNYALRDAGAIGLFGSFRVGGPWKVVQPWVGLSYGFLGQYGFDALGPGGGYTDFSAGLDVRVDALSVGVSSTAGFQFIPGETEEDPSELTGYRQVLGISTAFHF